MQLDEFGKTLQAHDIGDGVAGTAFRFLYAVYRKAKTMTYRCHGKLDGSLQLAFTAPNGDRYCVEISGLNAATVTHVRDDGPLQTQRLSTQADLRDFAESLADIVKYPCEH